MIYLDNAATTLMKPANVSKQAVWAISNLGSPGRGGHKFAMDAADIAFRCREKATGMFGVSNPENVIFTFNATHALNIAINALVSSSSKVVVTEYEHNSVMRPLIARGASVDIITSKPFDSDSMAKAFKERLERPVDVVVMNHVSNVFGFILPVERMAELCRQKGVPFIIDASQSAGVVPIDMNSLGAAFIAMPGHKGLYGPQGTGLLLVGDKLTPLLQGGTGSESASFEMPTFLPDRAEAGTHNMTGIAGLYEGLKYIDKVGINNIAAHERELITLMARELGKIPEVTVYSAENMENQSGVLSFTVYGLSSEEVGARLAKRGIAVRAGLHCSPLAHKSAGTFPDGTVRASVSAFNTRRDVIALTNAVKDIVKSI